MIFNFIYSSEIIAFHSPGNYELYLNNNQLQNFTLNLPEEYNLELHLQNNQLSSYSSHNYDCLVNTVAHASSIEINLSNNSFVNLDYIKCLINNNVKANIDLSYNLIQKLSNNDLNFSTYSSNSQNQVILLLNHNLIRSINLEQTADDAYKTNYDNNFSLDISDNPIVCECDANNKLPSLTFKKFYQNGNQYEIHVTNSSCQFDLNCYDDRIDEFGFCPDECECTLFLAACNQQLVINCSNSNLTKIPHIRSNRYDSNKFFETILLDMSHNNLININFESLHHAGVAKLNAAFNQISSLAGFPQFGGSIVLNLTHNQFKSIDDDQLINEIIERDDPILIYFAHNPWICDSKYEEIKSKMKFVIADTDKMTCVKQETKSYFAFEFAIGFVIFALLGLSVFIFFRLTNYPTEWATSIRYHVQRVFERYSEDVLLDESSN